MPFLQSNALILNPRETLNSVSRGSLSIQHVSFVTCMSLILKLSLSLNIPINLLVMRPQYQQLSLW